MNPEDPERLKKIKEFEKLLDNFSDFMKESDTFMELVSTEVNPIDIDSMNAFIEKMEKQNGKDKS